MTLNGRHRTNELWTGASNPADEHIFAAWEERFESLRRFAVDGPFATGGGGGTVPRIKRLKKGRLSDHCTPFDENPKMRSVGSTLGGAVQVNYQRQGTRAELHKANASGRGRVTKMVAPKE